MPLHVSSTCGHHQEVEIALHILWYRHTYRCNNGWPVPDAVDTVICAPDDGWRNHPKHVEQFTDKINCV